VVCDGLMVETAQRFEHRYQLPAGTANRPFQAAQWSGASLAIMFSAVAGGIIAQFFNLTTAAVISGIIPVVLAIVMAFLVKENKVAWDSRKARKGFLALGVIIIVAFIILQLKNIPGEHVIKPYEPLISALIIIGCLLMFVRIPRQLIAPLVLVFCWQAIPFETGAQYVYQYFTSHNTAFIDAVASGNAFTSQLKALAIGMGIADEAALAENGKLRTLADRLEAAAVGLPHVDTEGVSSIHINSLISHRNKKPRVDVHLDNTHVQLDAAAAIQIAHDLIECATAGIADSFLYCFATEECGADADGALNMVRHFREFRRKLDIDFRAMQEPQL